MNNIGECSTKGLTEDDVKDIIETIPPTSLDRVSAAVDNNTLDATNIINNLATNVEPPLTVYVVSDKFTHSVVSNSSLFTYTGTETRSFAVLADWAWIALQQNMNVFMAVYVNDVIVPGSRMDANIDQTVNAYPRNGSLHCTTSLSTGDVIRLKITNRSNTADIRLVAIQFTVTELA